MIGEHDILESPAWFPLEVVTSETVRLVRLDEAAYRAASFLDQRVLERGYEQTLCGVEILRAAASRLVPQAHYIFHTGHVGSTLVSRLVGEHEHLFSVREPALLRALANREAHTTTNEALTVSEAPVSRVPASDARASSALVSGAAASDAPALLPTLALFSRTWRPNQRAVIKATSFVSELAESILAGDDRSTAIFMFTDPLTYLRSILAGPNSRVETRMLAPARQRRLTRRLGVGEWPVDPGSEGEHIAMSWLCEMTALHQAAERFQSRVLWVHFDAFLGDPRSGLRAIFRTLGVTPTSAEIEALATGPFMQQYSKAPEHAYDADLRRRVLHSADSEHPLEIRRGMEWLRKVALRHPVTGKILASFGRS